MRSTHRSDLFSLGSVMYFMLTGHSPFRAETTMGVLNRIANDEPRDVRPTHPEVPDWLESIVLRLLAKPKQERFESAEALAELLEGCLSHLQQPTVVPLPASAGGGNRKDSSGRFGRIVAIGVFSFLALLAGTLIVLEGNKGTLRIESEVDDVAIRIVQDNETVKRLTCSPIR